MRAEGGKWDRPALDQHRDAHAPAQLVELAAQLAILHLQTRDALLLLLEPCRLHVVSIARSHVPSPSPRTTPRHNAGLLRDMTEISTPHAAGLKPPLWGGVPWL
jgi:hypothetical protein